MRGKFNSVSEATGGLTLLGVNFNSDRVKLFTSSLEMHCNRTYGVNLTKSDMIEPSIVGNLSDQSFDNEAISALAIEHNIPLVSRKIGGGTLKSFGIRHLFRSYSARS